jgi:hypothetical protein|tara:strand:+ start:13440 stop:14123 length:684 start_codon:yes stop_codon:yes gene_type:complete
MPKKKHDYIPIHTDEDRRNSHEYITKGTRSQYPISKWEKSPDFKYGVHFSKHVQGMFMYPRATLKRVTDEKIVVKDMIVPLVVVLIAGILTAIGGSMWNILISTSVIMGFLSTVKFFVMIVAMPIWFIAIWLFWTVILHVVASVMSGKDVLNGHTLHKNLKVIGFAFVPAFLNILPLFSLITGYWTWILCAWALENNYGLNKKRAFIATIPLLFAIIVGTFMRLSIL